MSKPIDPAVVSRLFAALKVCGLRCRNWSGGGEIVFAIYTHDDSPLGQVRIFDGATMRIVESRWRIANRERAELESLIAAWDSRKPEDAVRP